MAVLAGVSMLLQLVQDMQNLDYFIEHDTLIGALRYFESCLSSVTLTLAQPHAG